MMPTKTICCDIGVAGLICRWVKFTTCLGDMPLFLGPVGHLAHGWCRGGVRGVTDGAIATDYRDFLSVGCRHGAMGRKGGGDGVAKAAAAGHGASIRNAGCPRISEVEGVDTMTGAERRNDGGRRQFLGRGYFWTQRPPAPGSCTHHPLLADSRLVSAKVFAAWPSTWPMAPLLSGCLLILRIARAMP